MLNRTFVALVLVCFMLSAFAVAPQRSSAQTTLNIEPVYQQTPVWCWAAVGEMVFRHFGVANINPGGNFQCGIIALLHPVCNQNCRSCIVPAGSLTTMDNMLTRYPTVASQVTGTSTQISTTVSYSRLSPAAILREVNAGRPIVAGISPSGYRDTGISQHVALIIGFDGDALIVNDPFPFRAAFSGNPYEAAGGREIRSGRYRIAYEAFASRLRWRESIYGIRCRGRDCNTADAVDTTTPNPPTPPKVRYGRSCQTSVGKCGPFYNQPALPVGSACWCATPQGPVNGRVVQP
jgi:hypothetical protein